MAGGMHGRGYMGGMRDRGIHGGMHGRVGGAWHTVNERAVRVLLECILVFETNVYLLYLIKLNGNLTLLGISVQSKEGLWAFIHGKSRFSGLQSPLGITNGNRSHNKPLELI